MGDKKSAEGKKSWKQRSNRRKQGRSRGKSSTVFRPFFSGFQNRSCSSCCRAEKPQAAAKAKIRLRISFMVITVHLPPKDGAIPSDPFGSGRRRKGRQPECLCSPGIHPGRNAGPGGPDSFPGRPGGCSGSGGLPSQCGEVGQKGGHGRTAMKKFLKMLFNLSTGSGNSAVPQGLHHFQLSIGQTADGSHGAHLYKCSSIVLFYICRDVLSRKIPAGFPPGWESSYCFLP